MSEAIANRARRVEALKTVVQGTHHGRDPGEVARLLRETIRTTEAAEVLAMEQQLLAEGMSAAELAPRCGEHLGWLRDILVRRPDRPALPDGHPADTFLRETWALRRTIADSRRAAAAIADGDPVAIRRAREAFLPLSEVATHFLRKEKLLLPALARHGLDGPSRLSPILDAEVLTLIREAAASFAAPAPAPDLVAAIERAVAALERMIDREDELLLPVALDTLAEDDWAAIWRGSATLGWCLVQPGRSYRPAAPAEKRPGAGLGTIELATGRLDVAQLGALLSTLPVDLTFVDADDRVAFFNEGVGRLFERPKEVLGRKVQFCHPVGSIDLVDRILAEFRSGARDVAEFWIELGERFVHIRFFAVRGDDRRYLGALEVVQDITPLRRLEGQRRLLDEATP